MAALKKMPPVRDAEERNRIVEENLGLTRWAVHYYAGEVLRRDPSRWDDLVQAASLGLLRAAELWREERKIKFPTYAAWWMRQAIQYELGQRNRTPDPFVGSLHSIAEDGDQALLIPDPKAVPPWLGLDGEDDADRAWESIEPHVREREYLLLRLIYHWGLNQIDAGRLLGIRKTRAEQLVKVAFERLVRAGIAAYRPGYKPLDKKRRHLAAV